MRETPPVPSRTRPSAAPLPVGAPLDTVFAPARPRPLLRGWIHFGALLASLVSGSTLLFLARPEYRTAALVYVLSSCLLFGVTSLYHLRAWRWRPTRSSVVLRLDHSMIFVLMAGSYTPLAFLLPPPDRRALLLVAWVGALVGILVRNLWRPAPRWAASGMYLVLGWTVVAFLPQVYSAVGLRPFLLVLAGGIFYSLGAVVYATQRPDPSPRWVGFHEVFHLLTVGGAALHCSAVYLLLL